MKDKSQATLEKYRNCLNYTTCNEDSASEIKALKIKDTDTVVCITGSGSRTLDLLTERPQKILSVDFNPIQNYLLELKTAAIKNLNYQDYCGFLGISEMENREDIFEIIKDSLSGKACQFWTEHLFLIKQGIIYQGLFEQQRIRISEFFKKFRREQIEKMLTFDDLNEQCEYYHNVWDDEVWKFILAMENSAYNKGSFSDPAFYFFADETIDYSKFLHQRMEKAFTTTLVKENCFLALTINGSYQGVRKLPRYLEERYYPVLKRNIDKIEIVTGNIVDLLKGTESNSIDKFSLSDVSSYLNLDDFASLIEQIIRTGKNHSLLCIRNFLAKRDIPEEFQRNIGRYTSLEEELEREDLSFVYSFIVGEIIK